MKPKTLLEIITTRQRIKLSGLPLISEGIMSRGRTPEDIEIAIKIACVISFFDFIIFRSNPIKLYFINGESNFAGYSHPSMPGSPEESYNIYVANLSSRIKEQISFFKIISFNKDKLLRNTCSEEEYLLMIGAHEVRHRLQFIHNVKMFRRDVEYRKPFNNFVRYIGYVFEDASVIDKTDIEFDAKVVGEIFLSSLHKNKSLRELIDIIQMGR
ncbi:MAG: hypothetical protein WC470_02030 [Candidatus Paceibacterota bacterium]